MGKLFTLKKWLTVDETARHLSIVLGENVAEADVIQLALDRHLRLSVNLPSETYARRLVGEPMEASRFLESIETISYDNSLHMHEGSVMAYKAKGDTVKLIGIFDLPMMFTEIERIEDRHQLLINASPILPNENAFGGVCISRLDGAIFELIERYSESPYYDEEEFNKNPDGYKEHYVPLNEFPSDSYFVVRADELRKFEASINGATERADKLLTTTERNTLLTILGIMARKGYGVDLSKPYECAKEIHRDADLMGVKISDDTIAAKLKEAAKILAEKSE